jgi:7-dehydrocholesterol reductase
MSPNIGVSGLLAACISQGTGCLSSIASAATSVHPTFQAWCFLTTFAGTVLVIDLVLPGAIKHGPQTLSGFVPAYRENGLFHCMVISSLFLGCSNIFWEGLFGFGIFFDTFASAASILNIFGLVFAVFLYFKGLYFPSTKDSGSSGNLLVDFAWGTELYPKVLGIDVKRFINCRCSMSFWMLAGLSYTYRSYTRHGTIDYGLLFSAVSQYLYLVKFLEWEIGYMRSIDIIVDRAGYQIQWGCLVWVPCVYTFHTRLLVRSPSQLSLQAAGALAVVSFLGIGLNYVADLQRMRFRECNGKMKIWGREPEYIEAHYTVMEKGVLQNKTSLLLASGWWGIARHFHYVFELIAAWSWCLLANPLVNGALPLLYAVFLTMLLLDRAKRDETKCRTKYGKDYDRYCKAVPYLVIPGLY